MRMFFGVISSRISSSSCIRRQRLRKAMATARLAASWPMMCLSSSWTISLGVIMIESTPVRRLGAAAAKATTAGVRRYTQRRSAGCLFFRRKNLDAAMMVGVNANIGGDAQSSFDDFRGAKIRIFAKRLGRPHGRRGRRSLSLSGPPSGSSTSPVPLTIRVAPRSATTSMASRRRSARSERQSLANSTAARVRLPENFSKAASNLSKSVKASAVPPANPAKRGLGTGGALSPHCP